MKNTHRHSRILSILVWTWLIALSGTALAINMFEWRCVTRPSERLKNETRLKEFETFLGEIKTHGYNAVFFSGAEMYRIHEFDQATKQRFHQMLAKAKQHQIAIIPLTDGQGLPRGMGEEFGEGFPNVGTPFSASGGEGAFVAVVNGNPTVVKDPGFEELPSVHWKGATFNRDNDVKRTGQSSVSITNPPKNSMLSQSFGVAPYRTYELSVYVKLSSDLSAYQRIGFLVKSEGKTLLKRRDGNRNNFTGGQRGKGWLLHKELFSSRQYASAQVFIVATEGKPATGTIWFDDFQIKEVGLQETIIRPSTPVIVKSAATGKAYAEGKDYEVEARRLIIPAGSAISAGEDLLVDWYTAATAITRNPPPAYCWEETWDIVRGHVNRVDDWFQTPPARFMAYSEWRVAGWDPACISQYGIDQVGSGPYMGMVARKTENIYRTVNSNRIVLAYNDDFDPYHNAKVSHQAVNGGSFGSWQSLSEDMVIVNWRTETPADSRKNSMMFFAGMNKTNWPGYGVKTSKQRQIISAGRWGPGVWGHWLEVLTDLEENHDLPDSSVIGVNFHTYVPDYSNVGPMADFYKNAGRWGTGPIDFPPVGIASSPPNATSSALRLTLSKSAGSTRSIQFHVPENQRVTLSIRNLQGQLVTRLINDRVSNGTHGRTVDVSKMASGVYFVRLSVVGSETGQITRKMVLF